MSDTKKFNEPPRETPPEVATNRSEKGVPSAEEEGATDNPVVQRLKEELHRTRKRLRTTEEACASFREQLKAQGDVRRGKREVERQRDIKGLSRINAVIRRITQALVQADAREEIEQVVCDRLAEAEPYVFAWIGVPNPETYEVEPRAWSGDDDSYLQEVSVTFDDSETGQGPTGRAIRTRDIQVMQNLGDDPAYAPWRNTAREYHHWSSAAIPLVYEDTLYGVLNVYADRPDAFDEAERHLLAELGSTIPYAINTLVTKEKYRTFVEDVLDDSEAGIFILDADFDVVWANETVKRYLGVDRADVVGQSHAELIRTRLKHVFADPDAFEGIVTAAYADNTSTQAFECHVLPSEHREERWLHHRSQPIESGRYAGGRVELYSDVTERKRAEQQLRRKERELADFFENATVAMHWVGPDGIILRANQAELDLLGYTRDEYVGRHIADFHADQDVIDDILQRLAAGEELGNYEARLQRKDGSIRHVLISSSVRREDGEFIHTRCITRDITERKQAEEEARASEQQLQLAQGTAELGTWELNLDTEVLDLSPRAAKLMGLSPERATLARDEWREQIVSDDLPGLLAAIRASLENDTFFDVDFRVRRPDGGVRWVHSRGGVVSDASDGVPRLYSACLDVTERKRREARDQFLARLNQALQPLADPKEIVITAARVLGEHLGVDRCGYFQVEADEDHFVITGGYNRGKVAHIAGRWAMSSFGAEAVRLMREDRVYVANDVRADERITETDQTIYEQIQIQAGICVPLHKDGRFVAGMAVHQRTPRYWTPEEVELVTTVANRCWEALERARVTLELRESEERLRRALAIDTVGVSFFDTDGAIIDANDAFLEMSRYSRAELEAGRMRWDDMTPSEWMLRARQAVEELEETGRTTPYEKEYIRKDGSRWWALSATTRLDEGVGVEFIIDVSERKAAEEALRESEERLHLALEAAKMGAWELDLRTGDSPTRSLRHDRIFGYTEPQEDWNYEAFISHVHPDDRRAVQRRFEEALQTGTWTFECRIIRADDALRWIAAQGEFYYNDAQEPVRAIGVVQDITDRKRTDQALRELNETLEERVEQRTAQVRALTSRLTMAEQQERRRIAHILHDDLQQRLYGIQMRMTFLRKHAENGAREKLIEEARQSEVWIDEAIATTQQLSVDLSPPVLKNEGLADALGWLRTQMKELHELKIEIQADRTVRVSSEDMRVFLFQVVRELLFNVVKHAGVSRATVNITGADGDLVIRVVDGGCGFDPDEVGKRAHEQGFGLTAARERLELFGGELQIESAPGEGTCMTVRVPLNAKQYASFGK